MLRVGSSKTRGRGHDCTDGYTNMLCAIMAGLQVSQDPKSREFNLCDLNR